MPLENRGRKENVNEVKAKSRLGAQRRPEGLGLYFD